MTGRPWENWRTWEPPPGVTVGTVKRAAHECGWTMQHPFEDPAGFTHRLNEHLAVCPWPDMPEPTETVSD